MSTTTSNRKSPVHDARAAVVAVWDRTVPRRLAGALVVLLAGTSCSQLADLDSLSKNYGKVDAAPTQDGSQDQQSDRAVSPSDARDMSSTSDSRDAEDVASQETGSVDGAEDAPIDLAADSPPDDKPDGDTTDVMTGTDGSSSGDATAEGGGQICESEAVSYGTLELNTATPTATACGNAAANLPRFYAAVDPTTFGVAVACGACVRIQLSNVVVDAMIVDLGSTRLASDRVRLGVNKTATDLLLPDGSTFVADGVPWNFIPCPSATTGMIFTLQLGSSTTYSAMLIQNHRYRLQSVEYKSGNTFKPLVRTMYNYWVALTGMGAGPYTLRLTDVNGAVVEQSGIPLMATIPFQGQAQFPLCPTP